MCCVGQSDTPCRSESTSSSRASFEAAERENTRSSAEFFHHDTVRLITHSQSTILLIGSDTKKPSETQLALVWHEDVLKY